MSSSIADWTRLKRATEGHWYGPDTWETWCGLGSIRRSTDAGTPYLRKPGVSVVAAPRVDIAAVEPFLAGFDAELGFGHYTADPVALRPGAQLCKLAGQLCYASFGPKRTMNADAERYFTNIKSSGHGSVLEHACYSLLLYGTSRSVTHELVRHRAGTGFSQISQRYVSGSVLRFVERPEYQDDPELHAQFLARIDAAAADYKRVADRLLARQKRGDEILSGEAATDLRKKVQQAARSVLPNETEAPILVTANARAWRHIIEMRASPHAEVEVRELAFRICWVLAMREPKLFGDYHVVELPDGTRAVETDYRKV